VPLAAPLDARRGLLAGLIDHAPMFPPAELPLVEALREHEAALHSEPGWVANRFVVRASDVPDLPPDHPPRLSVVVDVPSGLEVPLNDPRTEAFELPPGISLGVLGDALEFEVYAEQPPGSPLEPLAELKQRAKIRCGGEQIPTVEELAAFIADCRRLQVPFKATAGLHHALRTGEQHGFLNLLAAAQFGDEDTALAETDPTAFSLDEEAFRWRDRVASPEEVATMRRERFVSFGSCSFDEPVDELRALGLL